MKRILIIMMLPTIMASCMMPSPSSFLGIIDYSPLIKNGIYVTESNSVNFKYTPIGSVISEDIAGYDRGNYVRPNIEVAFDKIKNKMKELDANGIINLKITSSTYYDGFYKMSLPMLTISGMAIRSEDIKLPNTATELLGSIDGIECFLMEELKNGIRIHTSKELNFEQIKRLKKELNIKQEMVLLYLPGKFKKNDAYAGINKNSISLYDEQRVIEIKQ